MYCLVPFPHFVDYHRYSVALAGTTGLCATSPYFTGTSACAIFLSSYFGSSPTLSPSRYFVYLSLYHYVSWFLITHRSCTFPSEGCEGEPARDSTASTKAQITETSAQSCIALRPVLLSLSGPGCKSTQCTALLTIVSLLLSYSRLLQRLMRYSRASSHHLN